MKRQCSHTLIGWLVVLRNLRHFNNFKLSHIETWKQEIPNFWNRSGQAGILTLEPCTCNTAKIMLNFATNNKFQLQVLVFYDITVDAFIFVGTK